MSCLHATPITVALSGDEHGLLIMEDGRLVAILVRLDADFHGKMRGSWCMEAGFGPCGGQPQVFPSLAEAFAWIADRTGAHGQAAMLDGITLFAQACGRLMRSAPARETA